VSAARLLLPLACCALAIPAAQPAHAQRIAMLPPDVDDGWTSGFMAVFREPPLWTAEAGKGYRTRMRVSLMAHVDVMVALRIDARDDGRLEGTAIVVRRGRGAGQVRDRRVVRYRISPVQMAELDRRATALDLWKFPRGGFEGEACIDGLEMVFERVGADGYRYTHANAQCTAPAGLRAFTTAWLEIAGVREFRSWLQ
jgi:hypothetical protein